MKPVYVLARTPGATDTVEWTDICQDRTTDFVMVHHVATRNTSRWNFVERKRPFEVCYRSRKAVGWAEMSSHKTLEAAIKAANKLAKEI